MKQTSMAGKKDKTMKTTILILIFLIFLSLAAYIIVPTKTTINEVSTELYYELGHNLGTASLLLYLHEIDALDSLESEKLDGNWDRVDFIGDSILTAKLKKLGSSRDKLGLGK